MHNNYHETVAMFATKSVLYEVSVSPKPGLVDRHTNGAHTDMDFFTFMASSSALSKGFMDIAKLSNDYEGEAGKLLTLLRPIGMEMEATMFASTNKVNTHKGIIFSLGILVAATVQVAKDKSPTPEDIVAYVKDMTIGLSGELNTDSRSTNKSNGEIIFQSYGYTGIRGEVEAGFPTVFNYGLDVMRNSYYTFTCKNDLLIHTLFHLMTACEDSNIISRHEPETLFEVQAMAKQFVESGGMHQKRSKDKVEEMDILFTQRNISPGGSADLLAVTIFFGLIENIIS